MASEEIGSLKVSLSLDDSDFNKPLASVDRNLKALGGELSIIRNKGKEWGDSLDGLRTKQDVLGRTLSTQETKVKSLREAYEKSVTEKGDDAAATENLAAKLNRAIAEYTRTETEIEQVNSRLAEQEEELQRSESAWGRLETSLDSASTGLTNAGDKMKGIGGGLTAGVTTPILGAAAAMVSVADQFDQASGRIQSGLGLSADEAKEFEEITKNLWKNAFGEDLNAAADALVIVKKNLADLPTDQLEKATEYAYILADRFEMDIAESTNTAGMIMKVFGGEAEAAFDLMTHGLQNAKGDGGELLETFNEYAPQFKALGYDAEGFMATLIQGSQSGAFNMDLLGDAAKESFLLIGEGSDDVKDALKDMGLDADQVIGDINSGGEDAQGAFMAVSAAISGIKNPTDKAAASIALFGTPLEDLGPEFQGFFDDVKQDLKGVEGSTQRAGDALYDNLGSKATSVFRDFQEDLVPMGEELVDLAEEYLPKVAETLGNVTEGFADMSPEARDTALKIAGVAAAAGPALVVAGTLATGLGTLTTAGKGIVSVLGKAGGAGLIGRIGLLGVTGPVGLAVAGVGLLGAGIYAVTKASEENTAESIKAIEAKQAEIVKNDELIANYESLRGQNKLSNDEMLRFLDIQAEIDSSASPDTIAALKDEQSRLLEKSTLTNDEMNNFLGLNQDIIAAAPDTVKAISDQGEAYAINTDALKELNAEKAREMEDESRDLLKESLENETRLLREQTELINGINAANKLQQEEKEKIRAKTTEIADIEKEIRELEIQKNGASLEQSVALEEQIRQKETQLWQAGDEKTAAEELLSTYGKQMSKKDEELEKNRQSLAQADEAKFKYEEIILAQADITSEKGRGLEKLNEEIEKLEAQKGKQRELLASGKINTAEYQTQIGKIDTQIGKFEEAQGELRLMNDIAGKEIFKDINMRENPRGFASYLNTELGRQINKNVVLKYNNMNGPQQVGGFATGTRYAPGGMSWVGEEGPELMYIPTGSRIMPAGDSETLLNKWNIPTQQSSSASSSVQSARAQAPNINVATMVVREEADIGRVAKELHRLQRKAERDVVG